MFEGKLAIGHLIDAVALHLGVDSPSIFKHESLEYLRDLKVTHSYIQGRLSHCIQNHEHRNFIAEYLIQVLEAETDCEDIGNGVEDTRVEELKSADFYVEGSLLSRCR